MIFNLEELHYNLKSLINELSDMHHKIINPIQAKKHNQSSFIIKIPKVILLIKVSPYLDYCDVITLSSTCTAMRKIIYSPIGFKILNFVHSPYPIIYKEIIHSHQKYNINDYHQLETFQLQKLNDQKNLRKSRGQCKKQLMLIFEKFKEKKQQHEQLIKNLNRQKNMIKMFKMQKNFLQNRKKDLQEQNFSYRKSLKNANEGFSDKIKQLERVNEELVGQNMRLQNQKGALVNKIRQYQNEIEVIKGQSQKSKQILKKIKNYLLYNEL